MVSGLRSHCREWEGRTDRQYDYIRVISCPGSARTIRAMLCKKLNATYNMPQPLNTLFFSESSGKTSVFYLKFPGFLPLHKPFPGEEHPPAKGTG